MIWGAPNFFPKRRKGGLGAHYENFRRTKLSNTYYIAQKIWNCPKFWGKIAQKIWNRPKFWRKIAQKIWNCPKFWCAIDTSKPRGGQCPPGPPTSDATGSSRIYSSIKHTRRSIIEVVLLLNQYKQCRRQSKQSEGALAKSGGSVTFA